MKVQLRFVLKLVEVEIEGELGVRIVFSTFVIGWMVGWVGGVRWCREVDIKSVSASN